MLSSLSVSDQVSHPYKITGKIMVMYILILNFLDSRQENRSLCAEWQQVFPKSSLECYLNKIMLALLIQITF
jgi:hypothetical protein